MLEASLVSTSWSDFIAESRKCMKKVDVKIIGRSHFLSGRQNEIVKALEFLSASGRRYENFTHFAQRPGLLTSEVINFLESKKGRWKKVKVWSEKFKNFDQVREFLSTFSESVENLDLRNISVVETSIDGFEAEFSCTKLKSLSLCNVMNDSWFLNAFGSCRLLESLEVENVDDQALLAFIQTTESLQRLSISKCKWTDEFFGELSKQPLSQLKEIKIKSTHHDYPEARSGLKSFLNFLAIKEAKVTLDVPLESDLRLELFNFANFNIL